MKNVDVAETKSSGRTENYFGPKDSGKDHGHVRVDSSGHVEYARDAGERSGGGKGSGGGGGGK